MPRFFLWIEYDGRPFSGWQRQETGQTVQGVLEGAVSQFDPRSAEDPPILVYGSGRTDAGVHARGQVAHLDLLRPDMDSDKLQGALNHHLKPHPIAVTQVRPVKADAHARFDARKRHYVYDILNRRGPPALRKGRVWHVATPLDTDAMQRAADHLVGEHDFTTFRHVHCQAKSPIKTLDYLMVCRAGDGVQIKTGARSFLHHQVRSMVGCLALVGMGRWTADQVKRALDAKDRTQLGLNAPPDGLTFERIEFEDPALNL